MSRDDSRLASVLGELADLGRRMSERAAELAGLVGEGGGTIPPRLADRVADVTTSVADLATAAAVVTAAADTPARGVQLKQKPTRAAAAVAAPRQPGPSAGGHRLRPLLPAVVSAAVNVALIIVLAVIFVAAEAKPKPAAITLGAAEESFVDEMTPVEIEPAAEAKSEQAAEPIPEMDTVAADAAVIDDVSIEDAAFAADPTAVMPVSFDSAGMLAAVGGAGGETAGSETGGGAAGGGAPGAATFFGRTGQGKTVCFVCDNSNSYRDGGFHTVLDEVARAVDSLRPDQSFFVVFFSDSAYPMFHPGRVDTLQPASPENKRRLRAWLATVEMCGGGQGIDEAVRIAGGLDADVIYFLSDGEHAASVVNRVADADFGGAVVHTFGMQQGVRDRRTGQVDPERVRRQQDCDRNLIAIATAHGGTFTPVMVPPQAAALERIRPITKNRAPGPVWGTRL